MFPDEISDSLEGGRCGYQLEIPNEKPRCCVYLLAQASFALLQKRISPHLGNVQIEEMTQGSVEVVENASDFTCRSEDCSEELNAKVNSQISRVWFFSFSFMPIPVIFSYQILITIIHASKRIPSAMKMAVANKEKRKEMLFPVPPS